MEFLSSALMSFPFFVLIHHVILGGVSGQGKGAEHVRLTSIPSLRGGTSSEGSSAERGTHHMRHGRLPPCK